MGCFTSSLKFIIIALNFILLFGSLVLVIFGILFHVGAELSFIEALESQTKSNIRRLITTTGIGTVNNIDKFSFVDLLGGWIAHTMIGVGMSLFILSFSGCCGAWYKIRCLLLMYIILLVCILFVEILIVSLMFAVPVTIQGQIKRLLYFTLADFTGLAGSNKETLGWMFVMNYYECCGVVTSTDFSNYSPLWNRTPGTISTPIDAPLICCKKPPTGGANGDVGCARNGASKDVYSEGCFDVIWKKVLSDSIYTYLIIGNIVLFQFYRDAKKKKKVTPWNVTRIKLKK